MKKTLLPILILIITQSYGCLVVEKIDFSIELKTDGSGTAVLEFSDIRSDAIGNNEFDEDKNLLFDYIIKSEDFLKSMKDEGKTIASREIFAEEDKLNGRIVYTFSDLSKVEGLRKEGGFIYLTMQLEDSIITTNGDIVTTAEYKRIIWEDTAKNLQFSVLSAEPERVTRPLLPYYKK